MPKQKGRKDSKLKINLEGGDEPRSLVLRRSLVDGLQSMIFSPRCNFLQDFRAQQAPLLGFLQRGLVLRGMEG